MYPSEYAYLDDSVTRSERTSANCRRYPSDHTEGAFVGSYIHCDGTQRKLTDSDLGREPYSSSDYYIWSAGRDEKLLFIFPTRISLTTITLHYYSDNFRGLPRLTFYAVPDDFDVWDAVVVGTPQLNVAEVPPGREPAGHRSVSINVCNYFDTRKVLVYIYQYSSRFRFALSEVDFITCNCTCVCTRTCKHTSTILCINCS